jgi:hypothetical protein
MSTVTAVRQAYISGFHQVYGAFGGGDERSPCNELIGYFLREDTAELACKGKGWYGGNGDVRKSWAVQIDHKWYLLQSDGPIDLDLNQAQADERLRKQTLAALTPEQKRVLGIK